MPDHDIETPVPHQYELYFSRSANSLRASIALELSGMRFHKHALDMLKDDHKSKEFLQLNPAGRVPVLVMARDGQKVILPQSGAIMEYVLGQHRPDLFPSDAVDRAVCNGIVHAAISDMAIQNALARYLHEHREAADFVFNRMLVDLRATFKAVQTSPFLCGDTRSIADYANFPVVYMREAQLRKLSEFDHVIDWLDRMRNDPAIARAVSYSGRQIEG